MKIPRFHVHFNDPAGPGQIILNTSLNPDESRVLDVNRDIDGTLVQLVVGAEVEIYDEDQDEFGNRDDLIARGRLALNTMKGRAHSFIKWVVEIDENGIRHESEIKLQR